MVIELRGREGEGERLILEIQKKIVAWMGEAGRRFGGREAADLADMEIIWGIPDSHPNTHTCNRRVNRSALRPESHSVSLGHYQGPENRAPVLL